MLGGQGEVVNQQAPDQRVPGGAQPSMLVPREVAQPSMLAEENRKFGGGAQPV